MIISIEGREFDVTEAPPIELKKLMAIVASSVALNSANAEIETIDSDLVVGILFSINDVKTLDKISDIVLWKTVEMGSDHLVTHDDFVGEIGSYYRLVAEAVTVNLADFFTFIDRKNAETREKQAEEERRLSEQLSDIRQTR